MSLAIIAEKQSVGVGSHAGATPVQGNNQRLINFVVFSNLEGVTVADNTVTLPPGNYYITVVSPVVMGENVRCLVWDTTNNVPFQGFVGISEWSGAIGPQAEKQNVSCVSTGVIQTDTTINIGVMVYIGNINAETSFGLPVNDGNPEIYTTLSIESM